MTNLFLFKKTKYSKLIEKDIDSQLCNNNKWNIGKKKRESKGNIVLDIKKQREIIKL